MKRHLEDDQTFLSNKKIKIEHQSKKRKLDFQEEQQFKHFKMSHDFEEMYRSVLRDKQLLENDLKELVTAYRIQNERLLYAQKENEFLKNNNFILHNKNIF